MRYALQWAIGRGSLFMIMHSFHMLTANTPPLKLLTMQCSEDPEIMKLLSSSMQSKMPTAHNATIPPTMKAGERERIQLKFDKNVYKRTLDYDVLFLAARKGCTPLVYYLAAHDLGNISDALLGAALGGQISLMHNLMRQKGSDEIARKSLWKAILYKQITLLSLCMHYDVDVEMRNGYGFTPLMLAASAKAQNVINYLYTHGAAPPTLKQLRRLTPRAQQCIQTNHELTKNRAETIQQCLEKKGLPRDLTRLLWEFAGLPSQYKPEGTWGMTPLQL